jgi:hypothetical protein
MSELLSPGWTSASASSSPLRYGADLTARQIAEILDMKTNAVEVALHRALRTLRKLLEAQPREHTPSTTEVPWVAEGRP